MSDTTPRKGTATAPAATAQTRSGRAFDLAMFLTIATGVSYILAWLYWSAYFASFGLPSDFVEIRIETIVAAVWPVTALYLLVALIALGNDPNFPFRAAGVSVSTFLVLLWFLFFNVFEFDLPWDWLRGSTLATLLIAPLLVFMMRRTSFMRSTFHFEKRHDLLIPLVIAAVIIASAFRVAGSKAANRIATGLGRNRVRVETRNELRLPADLALVAITRDRVVLVAPNNPNPYPKAIVLGASDVVSITAYRKP